MYRPSNGPAGRSRGAGAETRSIRPRPSRRRAIALVAAALAAASGVARGVARGSAAPAAERGRADVRFVLDDFEAAGWPLAGLWTAPPDAASGWAPSACRARRGQRALRAFAPRAADAACDAAVPAGAASTAWLHLDLRAAAAANRLELGFEARFALAAADGAGLVVWLLVPAGGGAPRRVPVFGATGDSGAWVDPARHLDLRNLVDIRQPGAVYDLRGGQWTLEWTAAAPAGAPPGGGVEVDDLSLVWEPDPSFPTPTRLAPPTATATPRPPTATPTAVPTIEPTPTAEPPTATPTGGRAYLPLVRLDPPPTPTPTETPTETPTPDPAASAQPTATPDPATPPPAVPTASSPAAAPPGRRPSAARPPSPAVLSSARRAPVAQWTEQLASNQ